MKTAPTNKKVRELINAVRDGKIIPRPEFQRRLVWKIEDKNHFLDSVIRGYPFPEIYLADGEVDLETGHGTQLLVDGLQRLSTIVQYFDGSSNLKLTSVPPYRDLTTEQKTAFLQYDVAVRDLGTITQDQVVEVFRRINATKYSLTDIEVSNAVYRGELKDFAEQLSVNPFFANHNVFGPQDFRRMGDLRFALLITVSALTGYFNRDDKFQEFLEMFNDEFTERASLQDAFSESFDFIDECGFSAKSRVWRKADLFTLIVELVFLCQSGGLKNLDPYEVVERLNHFYENVEDATLAKTDLPAIYYKATVQASNDRGNRLRRGFIIGGLLSGRTHEEIVEQLTSERLI